MVGSTAVIDLKGIEVAKNLVNSVDDPIQNHANWAKEEEFNLFFLNH
jgi:hypothetical protein